MSPPRATVVKFTATSQNRLLPSRLKNSCSCTWTTTYRLPGGPPADPASPSCVSRSCWPVAIPGGILTVSLRSREIRPAPRHVVQGLVTIFPAPWHCGQVRATVKNPCWVRTCPCPRHIEHVVGDDPGAAPDP